MTRGTSGLSLRAPFAFYDREVSSWRMWRATSRSGSPLYSRTFPSSGTMRAGFCYRLPGWALRTAARGSSSGALLPTPEANIASNGGSQHPDKRVEGGHSISLQDVAEHLVPTPTAQHTARSTTVENRNPDSQAHIGVTLQDWCDLLPTPKARDGKGRDPNPRGVDLNEAVAFLPTPKAKDRASRGPGADGGPDLGEAVTLLNTPTSSEGTGDGASRRADSTLRGQVDDLLPTPRGTDGRSGSPNQRGSKGDLMLAPAVLALMPTPSAADGDGGGRYSSEGHQTTLPGAAIDLLPTPSTMRGGERSRSGERSGELLLAGIAREEAWGPFLPAIRRWEGVLGRRAPWATEPSPRSKKGRLSPRFVEWMMGLAEGWVTAVPGLSRNAMLKLLGNGVVMQQAEEALRFLIAEPPARERAKVVRRKVPKPVDPYARMVAAAMKENQ